MNRTILGVTVAVGALVLPLQQSFSAVVVFQDDFSTDVAVSDMTISQPALQAGDVGKQWISRSPNLAGSDPLEHDPAWQHLVQVRSDDPVNPGNHHVRLERTPTANWGYAHAQLTDAAVALTAGQSATVSFSFLVPSDNTGGELRVLGNPSNTMAITPSHPPAVFTGNAFSVRFQSVTAGTDKTVNFVGGGILQAGTATWRLGEWNDVVIEVDYDAGSFFVEVTNSAGTTTSAVRSFQDAAVTQLGTVQFTLPVNSSFARIDNVVVETVPEPGAAIALLSVGGLLLRRRRV